MTGLDEASLERLLGQAEEAFEAKQQEQQSLTEELQTHRMVDQQEMKQEARNRLDNVQGRLEAIEGLEGDDEVPQQVVDEKRRVVQEEVREAEENLEQVKEEVQEKEQELVRKVNQARQRTRELEGKVEMYEEMLDEARNGSE